MYNAWLQIFMNVNEAIGHVYEGRVEFVSFPLSWMNFVQLFSKEEGNGCLEFYNKHRR
jgi:hypothetical protein